MRLPTGSTNDWYVQAIRAGRTQSSGLQVCVCVCVCVVVVSQSVCLSDIEYHCDSGQCVRASDVCDGHGQCADRSDELNCGKSLCVHPSRTFGDICSTQKSEDY